MPSKIEHQTTETGEELKRCSRCHQWLLLAQYTKTKARWDGLSAMCRACGRVRHASYYATHTEEHRQYYKEYNAAHKEEQRQHGKKYHLKRNYSISLEDYDRLFASQGGVCAICGSPSNGRALDVDHDHETGEVRSLLCNNCNRGLGRFKDNPSLLRRAADYVEKVEEKE